MPTFNLPPGYSFEPSTPDVEGITSLPGKPYGGADISQAFAADGMHWVGCNAEGPGPAPTFRWRIFHETTVGSGVYVESPLPFVSTGRGEQDIQWYDGRDWAIAWNNNQFNFDVVPGFVPFPSIPSIIQRLNALEAIGGGGDSSWLWFDAPAINPLWEGRDLNGGIMVDIPGTFNIAIAHRYLIRFVVQSPFANIRVRAGTQEYPFHVTLNTQAPNLQIHTQGWAPGPNMWVSTVNGPAQVWLQILAAAV